MAREPYHPFRDHAVRLLLRRPQRLGPHCSPRQPLAPPAPAFGVRRPRRRFGSTRSVLGSTARLPRQPLECGGLDAALDQREAFLDVTLSRAPPPS